MRRRAKAHPGAHQPQRRPASACHSPGVCSGAYRGCIMRNSMYNPTIGAASALIGFGSPETWRKSSRATQTGSGFFVTQHGSSFGGLCGALARVRRSQVRSSNPHSLPPSFGSEEAGLHTYLEPVMAQIPHIGGTNSTSRHGVNRARPKQHAIHGGCAL